MTRYTTILQVALFLLLGSGCPVLMAEGTVSLKGLIGQVLDDHPDVMAAYNRMQAEKASYKQARAGKLPTLDLQSGWGKQRRNSSTTRSSGNEDTHMTRQELSLSLRQPLFEGSAIDNRIEQSIHLYQARRQEWLNAAQDTALSIAEVYFTLLEKRRQLELAEENYGIHEKTHDQIRQRVEQGLASAADLSQMEGRTARAAANLMVARNNLDDAESQFFSVTDRTPGKLSPPQLDKALPYRSLGAARQLLMMHPQMEVANLEVEATENAYKVSLANYYPSMNLEVDRSWSHDADGVKASDDNFQAMLRMRYNLYRGGADKAAVSESAYRMAEREEIREKIRRQLNEVLELAWSSYSYLEKQMPYLEVHVQASQTTQSAYEEQFALGQRGLLDLLDSANELFQAQQAHTSAHYELLYARLELLSATGDLLHWLNIPLKDD